MTTLKMRLCLLCKIYQDETVQATHRVVTSQAKYDVCTDHFKDVEKSIVLKYWKTLTPSEQIEES